METTAALRKTPGYFIHKIGLDGSIVGTFKESFHKRHCIIPADAFYEWGEVGGKKYPFLFRLKCQELFGFAGIWQQDPKSQELEFTIITTEPNKLVAKIHDRMPAILPSGQEQAWLENFQPDDLLSLLKPYADKLREAYPVSNLVNSAKNHFPNLLNLITI